MWLVLRAELAYFRSYLIVAWSIAAGIALLINVLTLIGAGDDHPGAVVAAGLPGIFFVVSAMIVFRAVVSPFLEQIGGLQASRRTPAYPAILSRSLASVQGRVDYVRVRLVMDGDLTWAEPVLGKSGLINTMVKADGLIRIAKDLEGLEKGTQVEVIFL